MAELIREFQLEGGGHIRKQVLWLLTPFLSLTKPPAQELYSFGKLLSERVLLLTEREILIQRIQSPKKQPQLIIIHKKFAIFFV